MRRSLTALTAIALFTAPALAEDCAGSHAIDRCLVGKWQMTTNGMEAWAKKHLRNFRASTVKASDNTITLNADGSFATGASKVTASGTATNGATASSTMNAQASGAWSAAGGKFNLCARNAKMEGTTTITAGGHTTTSPVQHNVPAASTRSYTCAGATFSTTQQLRGDDVTSTYTKMK
jgi:hypothetical protein